MLIIKKKLGNIYNDTVLNKKIQDSEVNVSLQKLFLTRSEMEKIHLRKETDGGIEVGLTFEPGTKFHHGDVLSDDSLLILINQIPEKTIKVSLKNKTSLDIAVVVGHVIGNRHRPISINGDHSISFPIHDDSELDLFSSLFQESSNHLTLSIEETIFVPNSTMNVHEH
jgi:urease accessory protein|tara:strand:- start:833 stop:1336 length:504 start_codon:yes stop_codon:yes gene_type:complete